MTTSIQTYIQNFNEKHNQSSLSKWIHDHPTVVKVAQVAGLLLAGAAVFALCVYCPVLPLGAAITIGCLGGISFLSALTTHLFLKYGTCAAKDASQRAYKEESCSGGRLYYRGEIPVLEFSGSDPKSWGYAHGYILGAEIQLLKKNLDLAVHTLLRLPRAPNLQNVLREIRKQIPQEYLLEIQGMVEGYNAWGIKEKSKQGSFPITEDDILLMHLIPDSKHFHPKDCEALWQNIPEERQAEERQVACTSLLDRDDQGNVIFGRNMDWCPFGEAGSKSLVMVWKESGVAVLGVPGMIGAVTGWNRHNLALAMNVCPGTTEEARGMPAIFFNRYVLEFSGNVAEAKELAQRGIQPLGPYHMTMADAKEGSCISFYQDPQHIDETHPSHHIRDLSQNEHVEVLNWQYPTCTGGYFNSECRHDLLTPYFQDARTIPNRHPELMENALRLTPYVNSWITMHSLVFRPAENRVKMSWDNGYAASGSWEEAPMDAFFKGPTGNQTQVD